MSCVRVSPSARVLPVGRFRSAANHRRSYTWAILALLGRITQRGRGPSAAPASGVDVSLIVPTYNERDNIADLVERLKACLAGRSWEVIFVDDDSPDGTAEVVREI